MSAIRRVAFVLSVVLLAWPLAVLFARREPVVVPPAAPPASRVDLYGDPLPDGAVARLGAVRFSAGQQLRDVNFSPDGKTVAGQVYGGLVFWDVTTGKELRRFEDPPHDWSFYAGFAFSGDGKRVVAIGQREIHVWDVAAGKPLLLRGSWYHTCRAAFSPDGKILALSGARQMDDKSLKDAVLWDAATGEVLRVLGDAEGPVAYSPAGDAVGTCHEGSIILYDPATGKQRLEIPTGQKETTALAFGPDGKVLATAGMDRNIVLWDTGTGKELRRLVGHDGPVSFLRISADGKRLISRDLEIPVSSDDPATVIVWDLKNGDRLRSLRVGMGSLDVTPDGATLAVADGDRARLWDLATGEERPTQRTAGCYAIVFSRDGKTVVTGGRPYSGKRLSVLQVWDAASGRLLREWDSEGSAEALALSPAGDALASGGWSGSSNKYGARIWDVDTGRRIARTKDDFHYVEGLRFSGDGKAVSLINKHGLFTIESSSGKVLHTTRVGEFGMDDRYAFAAGARFVAVGVSYGVTGKEPTEFGGPGREIIYLLDPSTGQTLREFGGRYDPKEHTGISRLSLAPDERVLASVSTRGRVQLWATDTGKELLALPEAVRANSDPPVFSPDDALLAFGDPDGIVHVFETASGSEVRQFHGRGDWVWALAFSPDGATLAANDGSSSVLLWDVAGRGKPRAAELGKADLDNLWAVLAGEDAARAFEARQTLAAAGKQSAPFLLARLRIVPPSPARLTRLIADLDADDFQAREDASAELGRLGRAAEKELRKAREGRPSAEAIHRLDELLTRVDNVHRSPDWTRMARAVAALENAKAVEARQALEELAKGPTDAPVTEEAKAALGRLGSPVGR